MRSPESSRPQSSEIKEYPSILEQGGNVSCWRKLNSKNVVDQIVKGMISKSCKVYCIRLAQILIPFHFDECYIKFTQIVDSMWINKI